MGTKFKLFDPVSSNLVAINLLVLSAHPGRNVEKTWKFNRVGTMGLINSNVYIRTQTPALFAEVARKELKKMLHFKHAHTQTFIFLFTQCNE